MKRIKQVFSNIDTIAHLWASQAQEHARTPSSNYYFQGDKIYSYGSHYCSGALYKVKGLQVALLNSRGYSNTTAKHDRATRNAVSHMVTFSVPYPEQPFESDNVLALENNVADIISSILDRSQGTNISRLSKAITTLNSFIETFELSRPKFKLDPIFQKILVELDHAKRLKYFDKIKAQDELRKQANLNSVAAYHESAQYWVKHEMSDLMGWDTPAYMRVSKDNKTLETSHGAEVPLAEAVNMFQKFKTGKLVKGDKVGPFTFNEFDGENFIIGCHTIPLSVAETILKGIV